MKSLNINDLVLPWKESGLRIALLTNEELCSLTYDQILQLTPHQQDILMCRLQKAFVDQPENLNPSHATSLDEFQNLSLNEIRSLEHQTVQCLFSNFEGKLIHLLSDKQILEFDISELSDEQFNAAFEVKERIEQLDKQHIDPFIQRLTPVQYPWLAFFTKQQVKHLNFSDKLIDSEKFAVLTKNPPNHYGDEGKVVKMFDGKQIVDAFNAGLFTPNTTKYISAEQIQHIDFEQIDLEQKGVLEALTALFHDSPTKICFVGQGLEHIINYVPPAVLANLTEAQVKKLDVKAFDRNHFEGLTANPHPYAGGREGYVIKMFDEKQIVEAFNAGLFTSKTARYLSEEQIKLIDFAQIDLEVQGIPEALQALFDSAPKKICSVTKGLEHIIKHVSPTRLANLTEKQVKRLDVTAFDRNHFEGLTANPHPYAGGREGYVIKMFDEKQIVQALNQGLFSKATLKYLTDTQIALLKIETLNIQDQEIAKSLLARRQQMINK